MKNLSGKLSAVAALALIPCPFLLFPSSADLPGQEKIRVYVTDSKSWEVGGATVIGDDLGIGGNSGGARPQTAEITKTFNQRCPMVTITNSREKAAYVVLLDHEGGKATILRDNKVVIYNQEGDAIYSGSTRTLGNAVKDACTAIMTDRSGRP